MSKVLLKSLLNGIALALAWPFAATCWLERMLHPGREEFFAFWAQCLALGPGTPGMYLRRAFYRYTLQSCASDCHIGFGTVFSTRQAVVEAEAYVGTYALIGYATLRRNCLIGSRVSLLSGGQLHVMDERGNWLPTDLSRRQRIEIGENAWIGEGAVIMADVGQRAMVSAGAVVSAAVPERVMVAGNPARFVRRLITAAEQQTVATEAAVQPAPPQSAVAVS